MRQDPVEAQQAPPEYSESSDSDATEPGEVERADVESAAEGNVREEVEGAEVIPPPSPARAPQAAYQQRPSYRQRDSRSDQQRYRQSGSTIHKTIQDVEHIIEELKETLEQMEEVLETLEQAEREKTADERELEQLRRTLKSLHRGRENVSRYGDSRRPASYRSAPPPPSREPESAPPPDEPQSDALSDADEPQPS